MKNFGRSDKNGREVWEVRLRLLKRKVWVMGGGVETQRIQFVEVGKGRGEQGNGEGKLQKANKDRLSCR